MTWRADAPYTPESRKVRPRVIEFCQGWGLDIGPGTETICKNAWGVGLGGEACHVPVDLSKPGALSVFASNQMDFVFSSHCLEDILDTRQALEEWWRVVRPNGYLILYLPHRDLYPNVGKYGANPEHKHDFVPEDILKVMEQFAAFEVVRNEVHGEEDEYSFDLVLRKLDAPAPGRLEIPAAPKPAKTACVTRNGGYGDCLMTLPVLRELKRQGYHVTFNTSAQGREVMEAEPSIDKIIVQFPNQVPNRQATEFWRRMDNHYDRHINLNGCPEQFLLFRGGKTDPRAEGYQPIDPQFLLSHEIRHQIANRNYTDHMLIKAGMPELTGMAPERVAFTPYEERIARHFRGKHDGRFLVMLALGGSSYHKVWPHAQAYAERLLEECPDVQIVTVGEAQYQMMEWDHPKVTKRCGKMTFRQTILMASVCDLVVTPETGLAWATAGYENVRQLLFLSHSSDENLTRDWKNTLAFVPEARCHPCHQIHYSLQDCPLKKVDHLAGRGVVEEYPVCVAEMVPERIMSASKVAYQKWESRGREPIFRCELEEVVK